MTHAEPWLQSFHDEHPGCTSRAFAALRTADGRSSYDVLADEARPGDTVLDLACGDGLLLERVLARGASGIGVDISASELALAQRRVPGADLHLARAQQLPLGDDTVDLVVSHMALMLMAPLEDVLDEIGRVLRPGGRLAFVIGGGSPSGGWATFVEQLRAIPFEGVRLGDPRARDPEALAALIEAHVGRPVRITSLDLRFQADADGLWAFFEESYDLPRMGQAAAALLRERVREALPHPVPCGIGLWLARTP